MWGSEAKLKIVKLRFDNIHSRLKYDKKCNFGKHLSRRGAILLLLSHLCSNSLLHHFFIFGKLCQCAIHVFFLILWMVMSQNDQARIGWVPKIFRFDRPSFLTFGLHEALNINIIHWFKARGWPCFSWWENSWDGMGGGGLFQHSGNVNKQLRL